MVSGLLSALLQRDPRDWTQMGRFDPGYFGVHSWLEYIDPAHWPPDFCTEPDVRDDCATVARAGFTAKESALLVA